MEQDCPSCEQNSERCYWHHAAQVHFFMIMHGDFLGGFILPTKFTRHFRQNLDETARLRGPSGNLWPVGLREVDGNLSFELGWKDFLEDHDVQERDVLLMKYGGESFFDVLLFDGGSGCEKEYSYFARKKANNPPVVSDDSDVEIVSEPAPNEEPIGCDSPSGSPTLGDSGNARSETPAANNADFPSEALKASSGDVRFGTPRANSGDNLKTPRANNGDVRTETPKSSNGCVRTETPRASNDDVRTENVWVETLKTNNCNLRLETSKANNGDIGIENRRANSELNGPQRPVSSDKVVADASVQPSLKRKRGHGHGRGRGRCRSSRCVTLNSDYHQTEAPKRGRGRPRGSTKKLNSQYYQNDYTIQKMNESARRMLNGKEQGNDATKKYLLIGGFPTENDSMSHFGVSNVEDNRNGDTMDHLLNGIQELNGENSQNDNKTNEHYLNGSSSWTLNGEENRNDNTKEHYFCGSSSGALNGRDYQNHNTNKHLMNGSFPGAMNVEDNRNNNAKRHWLNENTSAAFNGNDCQNINTNNHFMNKNDSRGFSGALKHKDSRKDYAEKHSLNGIPSGVLNGKDYQNQNSNINLMNGNISGELSGKNSQNDFTKKPFLHGSTSGVLNDRDYRTDNTEKHLPNRGNLNYEGYRVNHGPGSDYQTDNTEKHLPNGEKLYIIPHVLEDVHTSSVASKSGGNLNDEGYRAKCWPGSDYLTTNTEKHLLNGYGLNNKGHRVNHRRVEVLGYENSGRINISRKTALSGSEVKMLLQFIDSIRPKNPYFAAFMQPTHVSKRSFLTIPSNFASEYLPPRSQSIFLKTPSCEKKWKVNYLVQPKVSGLSGNWRSFVLDNEIDEGDICLFELTELRLDVIIMVHYQKMRGNA